MGVTRDKSMYPKVWMERDWHGIGTGEWCLMGMFCEVLGSTDTEQKF